jgi:hypothetical protein
MLLGQPWLHNARVTHDWGTNLITIEGDGTIQIITVTKHLDNNTKHLELLLCYDLMEGVIDKEEEIFLATKPDLFTLGTITLSKPKKFSAVIFGAKVGTKDLTFNFPHSKGEILIDTIPTCIKVQELEIA